MSEPEKIETEVILDVPSGYRDAGRLDSYITSFVLNATRSKVQKAIKGGMVSVNGEVVQKVSTVVMADDRIVCRVMKAPPMAINPEDIPVDVRYEDQDVIVVNKPAGMVVHPAYGNRTGTLVNALLHYVGAGTVMPTELESEDVDNPAAVETDAVQSEEKSPSGLSNLVAPLSPGGVVRPGIVHRLDKDTSGLLVVAKHDVAHARLSAQFADRSISRKYYAIVWGAGIPDEGTIDFPVARSPRDRKKMAVVRDTEGKRAVTHYRVEQRFGHTAFVSLKLETGRTHQIRVHLQKIGHPIFGDVTYGGTHIHAGPDTRNRKSFMRNLFQRLPRQALHAAELTFTQPMTGQTINVEVPLPEDMQFVLDRLRSVEP
ncbi:MAG: RluA family pseudouridine synthase [Rhodothermales bacterium]|nr:RluA family pseudouridine synthase [Rhodothermales bacterium]